MNAEFNVWLLIVGLVVGAGLAWLVMMDSRRREAEIDTAELPREAAWLSAVMAEDGQQVSPDAAEQLLLLHRAYLGAPPPDPVVENEPHGHEVGPWVEPLDDEPRVRADDASADASGALDDANRRAADAEPETRNAMNPADGRPSIEGEGRDLV